MKEGGFDATDVVAVLFTHCIFSPRSHVAPCLYYVFGVAKSQAVSWAHFHMARTRRVKPMSLGFSSPRISRCFIMAMNSLLLSSPFPEEDRQAGERGGGRAGQWTGER